MVSLRKSLIAAALMAAFTAPAAIAGMTKVPAEATGHGKTVNEATADALAKAAAQVNGANVSLDGSTVRSEESIDYRDNRGNKAQLDSTTTVSASANLQTQGQIASYKVLSEKKNGDHYAVKVKAEVFKYESPMGGENKERLALLPVRSLHGTYDLFGLIGGVQLSHELGFELESVLTGTRQYSILDRAMLETSIAELGLIGSDLTGPKEKARLQQIKGADFLVTSTIREAGVPSDKKYNAATGQLSTKFKFVVQMRTIVPATGEVASTDILEVEKAKDRKAAITAMAELMADTLSTRLNGAPVRGKERAVVSSGSSTSSSSVLEDLPHDDTGIRLPFDR